jgi:DNA repair protein RadC
MNNIIATRRAILSRARPSQVYAGTFTADEILSMASEIAAANMVREEGGNVMDSPSATRAYFVTMMRDAHAENFAALFLDNRHRVLASEIMFTGTVDGASVHPREVVKRALHYNAAAVVFAHNHPSGAPEPSAADIAITRRLAESLALVDVRALDHIIVGGNDTCSLAERGLI